MLSWTKPETRKTESRAGHHYAASVGRGLRSMSEMNVVDERGRGDCKQETGGAAATGVDQDPAVELDTDYRGWTRGDVMNIMIPLAAFGVVFLVVTAYCLVAVSVCL